MVEQATSAGATITAQVFPRPVGLMVGLDLSIHPFVLYPSYQQIVGLPLAERVAEMRKPEVRRRILADERSEERRVGKECRDGGAAAEGEESREQMKEHGCVVGEYEGYTQGWDLQGT